MKGWIPHFLIVGLISIVGLSAIADAQLKPPRRNRQRIWTNPVRAQKETVKANIGESLKDIATRAAKQGEKPNIDIVFVVDGGKRMVRHLAQIEKQLVTMLNPIENKTLDYRFTLIYYQLVKGIPRVIWYPWAVDYLAIQKKLQQTRLEVGNLVTSGYGLDALMRGLNELDFRLDAATHFVVISNAPIRTSWPDKEAKNKVAEEIRTRCRQNNVHLNFIGINEKIQAELADETNGKWYPIDNNQRPMKDKRIRRGETVADKALLRVDGLFQRIAEHLVKKDTALTKTELFEMQPHRSEKVDIVFVFDYSLSMEPKVDAACQGLDKMVSVFNTAGLDYRFGLIRFWAAVGGGESTVVVTRPALKTEQVKALFRLPKTGDEHLLDAIIEGVPKLRTPEERELVLIIVTDESTSKRREKGYTAGKAIAACRNARARVYVIGGVTSMRSDSIADTFQRQVALITNGVHYIMPGSSIADEGR